MSAAELVLLVANAVYATSYVVTRLTLADVPPAALALLRVVVGWAVLAPLARVGRWAAPARLSRADRWRVRWMGILGFTAALALFHWGLARSTATNAALLVTVEPISVMLLAPLVLGERLTRREAVGAALALAGAVLVVADGVPGVTRALAPHWRGDLLLVLSGVAYASYSLFGREVLARHPALPVTVGSMRWGIASMLPLAAAEWAGGHRAVWTAAGVAGTAYLALVITALGYLVWNYALERVPAPRAAIYLNVQPLAGAVLGAWWLSEPVTPATVSGGALILAGLWLAMHGEPGSVPDADGSRGAPPAGGQRPPAKP